MNPEEPISHHTENALTVSPATEAEAYIEKELVRSKKALQTTQIASIAFCLLTMFSIGGITAKFAQSLEPKEAATIANGLVAEHVNDQIPEFKKYVKEKVPSLIAEVPGYVKTQLPVYRTNLETRLETSLDQYADQSSNQLQAKFDEFLNSNHDDVKVLMDSSQDPAALKKLDLSLRKMFEDYLNETQINGETLQSKVDQSLEGLSQIDSRMRRLASNKNLTDQEKKTRKAIAILLKNVDTNPNLAQAREVVNTVREHGAAQVQTTIKGVLTYTGPDEATFTEPGKAPVTFVRMAPKTSANPLMKKASFVSQTTLKRD